MNKPYCSGSSRLTTSSARSFDRSYFLIRLAFVALVATTNLAGATNLVRTPNCPAGFARIQQWVIDRSYPQDIGPGSLRYLAAREPALKSPRNFERLWQITTKSDLNENRKYLEQLIEENDPMIKFLESLGFKFDFRNGHTVPQIAKMAKRLETNVEDLVKSGRIARGQELKPARLFVLNGKIIPVPFGVSAPTGSKLYSRIAKSSEFFEVIAKGYWPIGSLGQGREGKISIALHDFGHFESFLRHPKFMAAVREFAKLRVSEQRFEIADDLTNQILESLNLGRATFRGRISADLKRIGLRTADESTPLPYVEILTGLNKLDEVDLVAEISSAYRSRHESTDNIGGLVADGFARSMARDDLEGRGVLTQNPRGLIEAAYDARSIDEKRVLFAKFLTAMDHTTRQVPEEWILALTYRDSISETSPIFTYVCKSGVFGPSDSLFRSFCAR